MKILLKSQRKDIEDAAPLSDDVFSYEANAVSHLRIPVTKHATAWKVSKYGVFSGLYFLTFGLNTSFLSVFIPNTGKYGPEKIPYLGPFYAVCSKFSDEKLL